MKCLNCHGDRVNNKSICEMCGFNNKKFYKFRNLINKSINFLKKFGKLIKNRDYLNNNNIYSSAVILYERR